MKVGVRPERPGYPSDRRFPFDWIPAQPSATMLRSYFMRNRELLAELARLAYKTVQQLMADAVGDEKAHPGVVAVPQTFGSVLKVHPDVHCLASRGICESDSHFT